MEKVTDNVFVEDIYPICNVGLVKTDDGLVMIDTPVNPTDAVHWRNQISSLGKLKYVINSEEHFDHCTNSYFFDGILITSELTRSSMAKTPGEETMDWVKEHDPKGLPLMEDFKMRLADITFEDELTLRLGKHTFRLISMPGHTAGNIAVYIPEEGAVFTADNVIYHGKTWLQEALPYEWLESIKKLESLDADTIIPGHAWGAVSCGKEYLKEQTAVVQGWIDAVKSAIKEGWSVEEAVLRIASPDLYNTMGDSKISEAELNKIIIEHLYDVLA